MGQFAPDVSQEDVVRMMFRIDRLSEGEQEQIFEKDKTQYLNWLNRDGWIRSVRELAG